MVTANERGLGTHDGSSGPRGGGVLRILAIILTGLVALVALTLLAVWLFVNPNDYKGRITAAVKSSTGRELTLPGDLKLAVFPWIALELGPATLGNPPGFGAEPFASVRHVAIRVRLLPLLAKRLEIGHVEVDGLDLRLRRNAQGHGNWEGLSGASSPPPAAAQRTSATALPDVSGVSVQEARLSYGDMVAEHVNLTVGHVATDTPVPLSLVTRISTSPRARPMDLAVHGELRYGDNALRASKLNVKLDDSTLRGDAAITDLARGAISFDLALDRIDLDRYLGGGKSSPAGAERPAAESSAPSADQKGSDALKTLRMDGKVAVERATVVGVTVTDAHANITAKDGMLRLDPVSAKLYAGTSMGAITVDDRGSMPQLKIEERLSNVDLAQFLTDFAKTKRISGKGNVTADLAAHGLAAAEITRTLNGQVGVDVTGGALEGIDLWFEVHRALALLNKQPAAVTGGSGRTKFDVFHATAALNNGVATTRDLNVASQDLRVAGEGTTDLASEAIDYRLKATLLQGTAGSGSSPGTLAEIPLSVTGTFKSPAVRPDLEAMARTRVRQEIDKHKGDVQQKLQDALKGLLK